MSSLQRLFSFFLSLLSPPFAALLSFAPFSVFVPLPFFLWFLCFELVVSLSSGCLARRVKRLQSRIMGVRDERTKVLGEFLSSMKIIKLYAWEESFRSRILGVRLRELSVLWSYQVTYILTRLQWLGMPLGVSITTFGLYVLRHGSIDPAVAFTALALFNTLGFPMQVLPLTINNTVEARVALKRIQAFLLLPELPGLSPSSSTTSSLVNGGGLLIEPRPRKIKRKAEEASGTGNGAGGHDDDEEDKKKTYKCKKTTNEEEGRDFFGENRAALKLKKKGSEERHREGEGGAEREDDEAFVLPPSLPRGMIPIEVKNSDVYWPNAAGGGLGLGAGSGIERRLFTNLQFKCYSGKEGKKEV